jgi:hypothetical protein
MPKPNAPSELRSPPAAPTALPGRVGVVGQRSGRAARARDRKRGERCRSRCACWFLRSGSVFTHATGSRWPAAVALRRLGHGDVRTTYNRYGKVVPQDLGPAAAQLDEYFRRARARLETSRDAGSKTGGTVTGFRLPPACPQRARVIRTWASGSKRSPTNPARAPVAGRRDSCGPPELVVAVLLTLRGWRPRSSRAARRVRACRAGGSLRSRSAAA